MNTRRVNDKINHYAIIVFSIVVGSILGHLAFLMM